CIYFPPFVTNTPVSYTHLDVYKRQIFVQWLLRFLTFWLPS
ncbi:hypothetical protein A5872_002597, partial [Enterococcus faecium]